MPAVTEVRFPLTKRIFNGQLKPASDKGKIPTNLLTEAK
jgi:hypothetical protein